MKKLDGRSKAARAAKVLANRAKLEAFDAPPAASLVQVGGSHYVKMDIQPWDAMQAWMSKEQFIGFLRGNAIKYMARADAKGGIEDYKKSRHYQDKLIEVLGG